jgi:hypothetical protein
MPNFDKDLDTMYNELQPTARKVLNTLDVPEDLNILQTDALGYLKMYIKGLSKENLQIFLRFVTG